MNFLDPALTSDGQPYAPYRYNKIIEERYIISKHTHTSYTDVGYMTPSERFKVIEFINSEAESAQKQRDAHSLK